ncbi:MAG: hypothetical protein M1457_11040 [bacterium]|nr:hypothetical protein [bacterium]
MRRLDRQPYYIDSAKRRPYRFRVCRNFGPISAELLAPYQIVIVVGGKGRMVRPPAGGWPKSIQSLGFDVPYAPEEVAALREYVVKKGGRILLFGSAASWCTANRRATGAGAPDAMSMPLNQIATPLGFQFQDSNAARVGRVASANKNVMDFGNPSFSALFSGSHGCALKVPAGAQVLLEGNNRRVAAAASNVGEGFVVAIGLEGFYESFRSDERLAPGFAALLDWIVASGTYTPAPSPYDDLNLPPVVCNSRTMRIRAIEPMKARALEINELAVHAEQFIPRVLKLNDLFELVSRNESTGVEVLVRVSGPAGSAGRIIQVGGYSNNAIVPIHHEVAHMVWPNKEHPKWFVEPIANYLSYRGRMDLGFKDYAMEKKRSIYKELAVAEANGPIDLARYENTMDPAMNLKGLWILHELENKYGEDFMARYIVAFRAWRSAHPGRTLNTSDVVKLFSSAASEDLMPWFKQVGTFRQ